MLGQVTLYQPGLGRPLSLGGQLEPSNHASPFRHDTVPTPQPPPFEHPHHSFSDIHHPPQPCSSSMFAQPACPSEGGSGVLARGLQRPLPLPPERVAPKTSTSTGPRIPVTSNTIPPFYLILAPCRSQTDAG